MLPFNSNPLCNIIISCPKWQRTHIMFDFDTLLLRYDVIVSHINIRSKNVFFFSQLLIIVCMLSISGNRVNKQFIAAVSTFMLVCELTQLMSTTVQNRDAHPRHLHAAQLQWRTLFNVRHQQTLRIHNFALWIWIVCTKAAHCHRLWRSVATLTPSWETHTASAHSNTGHVC